MPDGSSSAAPVMTLGPSFAKKRFSQFDFERAFDIKLLFQREPALVELNICRADRRFGFEWEDVDLSLARQMIAAVETLPILFFLIAFFSEVVGTVAGL